MIEDLYEWYDVAQDLILSIIMSTHDTKKFKKLLEEEKDHVVAELEKIAVRDSHNEEDWVLKPEDGEPMDADSNEAADEIEDLDTRAETLRALEERYENIQIALEKIEDGTYGIDEIDGEPIPGDRLMANPAARTKVENAHMLEK